MKSNSERSFTYSLIGLVTFFLPVIPTIMTILGLVYGHKALKTETDSELLKKAKTGVTLGYVALGVNILYSIFAIILVVLMFDFMANVWCGLNGGTDCNYIIQY